MGVRGTSKIGVLRLVAAVAVAVAAVSPAAAQPAAAPPAACTKSDFEAVVDDAAASLRDLNQKHKPDFQERLKALKDKRGWGHDQFMKEAAPFVKDDAIASFEAKSFELLEQISTLGQDGAAAKTPDCGLLVELQARMKRLVDIQGQKWTYMFGKIDAELAK
ncbi:MAG: hypothetical protein ABL908_01550 [Hyphomicrobium sp.]